MSKINLTPEQKAKQIAAKKMKKDAVKKQALKQKEEQQKAKALHKEVLDLIKADKPNQEKYIKEVNAYIQDDKKRIKGRIAEVEKWYDSIKRDPEQKAVYNWKLNKAKSVQYDFADDIKFENVSLTYSKGSPFEFRALNGTDLTIKKDIITAVIGMTGSGKSTLIQLTNGLLVTETGRTKVGDYQILAGNDKLKNVKELRREIGLVFQFPEYQLFQDTIEKDIAFGPINLGGVKKEALAKVPELLELVDLPEDYLKRSPFDLSGGQKRRVAIAGIIALDGNTLVLDEPTGGLDPQGEEDFMNLFNRLNKEKGKRIIIVTHNMDHVLRIADEVVVMHKGKVIAKDTPFKIFSDEKLLHKIEIEPPKLYKLAHLLKQKGLDVTDVPFRTVEELAKAIKAKKKK